MNTVVVVIAAVMMLMTMIPCSPSYIYICSTKKRRKICVVCAAVGVVGVTGVCAARAWRHGCLTAVLHDRSLRPVAVDGPEPTRRSGRGHLLRF